MFTWLNKQGVRSDRGFEVQFTGRFSAEYREGGKFVKLYVEDGLSGGLQCISINPDAFDHWSDGQTIPPDQQMQMFENFKEAMEFQNLKMVVERGVSPTGYKSGNQRGQARNNFKNDT
jgi:hypothetical protein